jgi:hypothetical protein
MGLDSGYGLGGLKPGVCLSTARPTSPFDGQVIYMTDVDQIAVWDGSQWTVLAPIAGGRNQIINGAMSVWQRGTSFTASSSYTADRFLVDAGTVTRQTGTGQFPYCLRIANSTGNPAVRHAIELPAAGVAGLFTVGSTWTVSFYARTSTTVTSNLSFYAAFCDSNLVNNNQIVLDTALPVPTTSWARYSKTFTIGVSPLGGNLGMTIVPFLNSGSYAGNFEITGIQLEAGSVATPFEFEDYSETLAKCQRYYMRWNTTSTYGRIASGSAVSTTNAEFIFPYQVQPRIVLGTLSAGGTLQGSDGVTASPVYSLTRVNIICSDSHYGVTMGSGSLVQYRNMYIEGSNSTTGFLASDMEL